MAHALTAPATIVLVPFGNRDGTAQERHADMGQHALEAGLLWLERRYTMPTRVFMARARHGMPTDVPMPIVRVWLDLAVAAQAFGSILVSHTPGGTE